MKNLKDLLENNISSCRKCKNKRQKMNLEQIQDEKSKKALLAINIPDGFSIDYALYCSVCNEYSVIFKEE